MTWNAEVELDIRLTTRNSEQLVGAWLPALADYHPVIGSSATGNASVLVTLPAESLRQATTSALAVVQDATKRTATAVQVMTTEAFDAIAPAPEAGSAPGPATEVVPPMLSVPEAAERLGLTRQAVLLMVQENRIPHGRIGRTWGVLESAVEASLKARRAGSGAAGSPAAGAEEITIPDYLLDK